MKKLMNDLNDVVLEMLHGIVLANPELALDEKYKIIYKAKMKKNKVAIISGGGSGHEPAHAGYVGEGMLDAAVCGDVFASPSQVQIYQGIKKVGTSQGVLLLVKNYSGDIMNFKNAMYLAREDGIPVEYVKIDDDIAVEDSLYTIGHRGVAGTVLIEKIIGAASELGLTLKELKQLAEEAVKRTKTIGFALSSSTVPAKGTPTFEIAENEIEFGVGIHGEPGIKRIELRSAESLSKEMLNLLFKKMPDVNHNNKIALMINGFGSTPLMELYIFNHNVSEILINKGYSIVKTFVGNYMTSIDMAGASITLMSLDNRFEDLLVEPVKTSGFYSQSRKNGDNLYILTKEQTQEGLFLLETNKLKGVVDQVLTIDNIIYIIDVMADTIIKNERAFCDLDAHAGDGDFGMSLAKGFRSLKNHWQELVNKKNVTIESFLYESSMIIMENCGGASGPIWGTAFRSASKSVKGKSTLTVTDVAQLLTAMVEGIQLTGARSFGRGAEIGDKTLIDALLPCTRSWHYSAEHNYSLREAFEEGAKQAVQGAERTKEFSAKMGRAGTVGNRSIGYPDAGAHAIGVIFTAIFNGLSFKE